MRYQSLQGLRVLNTRPVRQASALSEMIRQAGGVSIECPTLHIQGTKTNWLSDLPNLQEVQYAIFISANAVDYCFKQLNHLDWPRCIKVITIGKASSKALQAYQISVYAQPRLSDSEHLLALPCLQTLHQQTVLLFKGTQGRTLIQDQLLIRGAKLFALSVYESTMPTPNPEQLDALWQDNAIDVILITSEQSLQNLFQMFHPKAHRWLQQKPCVVLSERLRTAASLIGMQHIIISPPDKLIDSLLHSF